jgi:hypothetical protein
MELNGQFIALRNTFWKLPCRQEYFLEVKIISDPKQNKTKQEVLGRTNLLSFIQHGPHCNWRIQQFFCCCRGNVFTELLPSNDRIFTEPLRSNDKGGYTGSNVIS